MSMQIPIATQDCLRQFNDLAVQWFGLECTLYIPTNLTELEPNDMYTSPDDITYTEYLNQLVWFEWQAKDIVKLRKNGVFTEHEAPITARFKNDPEVVIGSYIILPTRFLNNQYGTPEFECVTPISQGLGNAEIFRRFKMAPRRAKDET